MGLIHQLDASAIATLFSDTGKTTQVSNGGTVAAWVPLAGSITTDALQSTAANRPTYRSNYGSSGYAGLEFDGSNDQMSIAHSSSWNATVLDVFIVLTSTNAAGYKGIFNKWTDGSWGSGWGAVYDSNKLSIGAPSWNNAVGSAIVNNRLLVHIHFESGKNGADQGSSLYLGGTAGTGPANNSASVIIGNAPPGGYPFAGAFHEIRTYSGGETDQDIVTIKNTLRSKWGLAAISGGGGGYYNPFRNPVFGG